MSSGTSDRLNAYKLNSAMSGGICPLGVSVAMGGKGLSETGKGHSIEECPDWCLVSSCFLFLLWS